MKVSVLILFILLLVVSPIFVCADCSKTGTTVIFVNGIFGTEASATADKDLLQQKFLYYTNRDDIKFLNGFNESHVAKLDDLVTSAVQAYVGGYLDHDLTDILRQVHADLQTQKIILVGHSQGTFYTNAAYDYLVGHGVDKNSIAVYNVATPADRVAGPTGNPGKYLNSSTDEVINSIIRSLTTIAWAKKPLPANINIVIPNTPGVDYQDGHSFSQVYLALAPDRIIGDIDQELNGLTADNNKNECFTQPELNNLYWVANEGYKFVDDLGEYNRYYVTGPPPGAENFVGSILQSIYNFGSQVVSDISQTLANNNLFGASISGSINQNTTNNPPIVSTTQTQTTITPPVNTTNPPPVQIISLQDQLDNIQESLDILTQQIQALINQQNPNIQLAEVQTAQQNENNNNQNQNQNSTQNNNQQNYGLGGSSRTTVYPQILISEVQVSPTAQRFIELYNPNSTPVSLTDWYLQRKDSNDTSWNSLVSSTNFSGKTIPAGGYFLISRQLSNSDILSDITLSNDNSLALKNPNEEIVDQITWSQITNGLSWCADFSVCSPTPKAQNIAYTTQPIQPINPTLQNILISEIQIEPIAQRFVELYNPNSTDVDLTGWYLQRKDANDTSWNSLVSSTNFSGKTIPAGGYFLISRQLPNSDILSDITLSENNSLALKKSDGTIVDTVATENPPTGQSIGRKVLSGPTEQDTDDNLADFELDSPTPGAQNITYVAPTDITAPQVSFTINAVQNSLTFPINFTITDPIIGTVSPSGISSYVFQWQVSGDTTWQQDTPILTTASPSTLPVVKNFTGQDGKTYNFQVQATDNAGNVSEWLPTNPATTEINIIKNILISEIQINPIAQRFVELYNPNSTDVDLTGWYLQRKTQGAGSWSSFISSTNFKNKIIPANGYFLISRQLTGSDILSSSMTLSDDNSLALKKPDGTISDKVGYGRAPDFETAPTVNFSSGQSISRMATELDTDNNSFDFEKSTPTPKAQNQIFPSYDATISSSVLVISSLLSGPGTISGILCGTSKSDFESYLTPAMHATLDFSGLGDPVVTGNTVVSTAQDGTTKATYTLTVDTTPYLPGKIDSFTSGGQFAFHTSDFMPNHYTNCMYNYSVFKGVFPSQQNILVGGSGPCSNFYPSFDPSLSIIAFPPYNRFSPIGEYDVYASYCDGDCLEHFPLLFPGGDYYRVYFDGINWSAISLVERPTLTVNQAPALDATTSPTDVPLLNEIPLDETTSPSN